MSRSATSKDDTATVRKPFQPPEIIPLGLTVEDRPDGVVIRHRRTGMRAMNTFVGLMLVFCLGFLATTWTAISLKQLGLVLVLLAMFGLVAWLDFAKKRTLVAWLFVPCLGAIYIHLLDMLFTETLVVLLLISILVPWFGYLVLSRKTIQVRGNYLSMRTELWGLGRTLTVHRKAIRRLVQVQEGGRDEDIFPSWGLHLEGLEGTRTRVLLYRQPYEQSRWLGQKLAHWARTEFIPESRGR